MINNKMSETTELPSIREIEGLWYELQREMFASGQVVSYETTVVDVMVNHHNAWLLE